MSIMLLAVSDLLRYLVFPIFVLAVGAVFTGAYPWLTKLRDDHRKALEVKTQLVTEMSEVVIGFVTAVEFEVRGLPSQSSGEYDEAYKCWETQRAVLGTKLEAYFPKAEIKADWRGFVKRVRDSYDLTQIQNLDKRKEKAIPLLQEYGKTWPQLNRDRQSEWEKAWEILKEGILEKKGELIDTVMESPIRLG
jgi:hypothetical protein